MFNLLKIKKMEEPTFKERSRILSLERRNFIKISRLYGESLKRLILQGERWK